MDTDFPQFYQAGGVHMHVITLMALAGGVFLVQRLRRLPGALVAPRPDVRTPALIVAMLLVGVMATGLGMADVGRAMQSVPAELHMAAWLRALGIVFIPLVWSTMCAVPLVLAHGVLRHREQLWTPASRRAQEYVAGPEAGLL